MSKKEIRSEDIYSGEAKIDTQKIWTEVERRFEEITPSNLTWVDSFFGWDTSAIQILRDEYSLSLEVIGNMVMAKFLATRPYDANRFMRICQEIHKREEIVKLNKAIKENEIKIKSLTSKYHAIKNHAESSQRQELNELEQMWLEWKTDPDSGFDYKNNEDFATEAIKVFPNIARRTVLDKCSTWAKKHKVKVKRGRPKNNPRSG